MSSRKIQAYFSNKRIIIDRFAIWKQTNWCNIRKRAREIQAVSKEQGKNHEVT